MKKRNINTIEFLLNTLELFESRNLITTVKIIEGFPFHLFHEQEYLIKVSQKMNIFLYFTSYLK